MNELTKFLVNELIDGKSVTAIYGGGFKPPTKGHFDLVKTALKDFKDIDKFIIYVGGGVRDGIEQEQSMQVWDIYKELLPSKVQIEPSPSPIGDVLRYAKNNPDEKVYFLLGYREGREDDLNDIKSRTKGVEEKYPNLEVRVIKSPEGDMSGTNARKALKQGDKEKFFTFLPEEIPANEKEDIYNILEPNILKEGDPKVGTGKKPKGSGRRLYTDEDPSDTVKVKFSTKQDIIDTLSKASFKSKSHARQSQIINLIHQRVRAAYERAKDPDVKRRLKTALDYAEQRKEASKEKTERLNKLNEIDISKYIGSWVDTKKLKRPSNFPEAIFLYLKKEGYTNKGEIYRIITLDPLVVIIKQNTEYIDLDKFLEDNQNIEPYSDLYSTYQDEKEVVARLDPNFSFEDIHYASSSGMNMNIFLKNLDKNKLKNDILKKDQGKLLSFTKDRDAANDIFYTSISFLEDDEDLDETKVKEASKAKTQRLKKENVAPNHDGKSAPFGSGYKPLKENTIPSINILEKIAELTNYMRDKGYNIDPVPSIELVDDDMENAGEFLGKTAYYDPINKSITLYTYGRHPKDIVRSFSHEMIHHIQNLEGRLGDVSTTNTLEDDHVNDLEKEANLKGTMTFRNWTDSIQEKKIKDPFGLNAYARELAMGLQEVGEATSKQYEWEIINSNPGDYEFSFTTDSGIEYDVELTTLNYEDEKTGEEINGLEIGFGAGEGGADKSDKAVINRGEVFRVMATIVNIIQYATKLIPDFKNTNALIYNPAPKKGEDVLGNQRDKLYQAFIKKVYPKAKFEREGSALVAKLAPLKEISYLHNTGVNENDGEMREKKYVIYSDMDGVITDFDKRFMDYTEKKFKKRIPPSQYESENGKEAFWDFITKEGVKFWVGMDWMPDGKTYWNYIKKYNPILLSAPSREESSKLGKRLWVKKNLPGTKLMLAYAKDKQKEAAPNHILIDDRKSNIDEWRANGGIGILHTSAASTIEALHKIDPNIFKLD